MGDIIDTDLGDVPELELVPEGEQRLQCIAAERTDSRKGDPMLHVTLEYPQNELAEEVHEYIMLPKADDDQKTAIRKKRALIELLDALGVRDYEQGFDVDELIGKEGEAVIQHEESSEYGDNARIQNWVTPA